MRIEIDGKDIDVPEDSNIKIVNQWFSFDSYFKLNAPVATSFKVLFTPRNKSVLTSNTTTNGQERIKKRITIYFWQSVRVFEGECWIDSVSDGYKIQAFSGKNTLRSLFENDLIHRIQGFPSNDLVYNQTLISDNVDNGSENIKTLYFDVGRHPSDVSEGINYDDFFLWFKTKYIIEQIFADTNLNYSVNWNFDTTELEKDYTASRYPMRHDWASNSFYLLDNGVPDSTSWSILTSPAVGKFWGADINDTKFVQQVYYSMRLHDFETFKFETEGDTVSNFHYYEIKAKTKFRIDVDVTGTYTGGDGFLYGVKFVLAVKPPNSKSGDEQDVEILKEADCQVLGANEYFFDIDSFEFEVDFGYKLFYYFVFDNTSQLGEITFDTFSIVINPNQIDNGSTITYGETFTDISTLPNIKKVDYIKDILNHYSLFLVLDKDKRQADFYSFNSVGEWSQNAIDLSQYIDVNSIEINTKPPIHQEQRVKYKEGESFEKNIFVSDQRLDEEGSEIVISQIYDLTQERGNLHLRYDGLDLTDDNGNISKELPYIRGSNNSSVISIPLKISYPGGSASLASDLRAVSYSKYDLSPSSMIDNEHETKVSIMEDFFNLKASFNFPRGFQNTLTPNQAYYINVTSNNVFISAYFILESVIFSESGLTRMSLVRINKIKTGTPPPQTPWQWNDEENIQWNDEEPVETNN